MSHVINNFKIKFSCSDGELFSCNLYLCLQNNINPSILTNIYETCLNVSVFNKINLKVSRRCRFVHETSILIYITCLQVQTWLHICCDSVFVLTKGSVMERHIQIEWDAPWARAMMEFSGNRSAMLKWILSALHSSDFGTARYGLVYATGRQRKYSPIKQHSADGVRSTVTRPHCSHCAYNGEMLFWTVVLSRACAERVILTPASVRR
jgi:hypothetical protein